MREESGRDGSREVVESRPWTALQALAITGFYSEKGEATEVLLQLSYMILYTYMLKDSDCCGESRTQGSKMGQRKVLQRSRQKGVVTCVRKITTKMVRSDEFCFYLVGKADHTC